MNNQPDPYDRPVPVSVASTIAARFNKDMVIILCWDAFRERLYVTTWGRSAGDKLRAAEAGTMFADLCGVDIKQERVYEDFRLDAARLKVENDALKADIDVLKGRLGVREAAP